MTCRQIQSTVKVGRIFHLIPVHGTPDDLSLTVHRAKPYGEEIVTSTVSGAAPRVRAAYSLDSLYDEVTGGGDRGSRC
jgi:hypothetical protein